MTAVAFDTLKLAERLHGAGFTRKQASGAAEALSEALSDSYTSKVATTEAVETLGRAIDKRFNALDAKVDQQGAVLAQHSEALAKQGAVLTQHSEMLAKQGAVLAQHGEALAQHGGVLAQHGGVLAQHGEALARIESMMAKLLEGQAVLHQNDMELKRRLDERKL